MRIISKEDAGQLVPVRSISSEYHYERKDLIMTPSETRFFKLLDKAIGKEYHIFPQVHLHALFEHRVRGQNWWAALHHINRKSVDFVICDKEQIKPILAIELDDWSHEREDRKARDVEVERIFTATGIPLLRIEGNPNLSSELIERRLLDYL